MRFFTVAALFFIAISANVTVAHGECYGEAAAAYGCGVPVNGGSARPGRASPSLEEFGSKEGPVLPDTGYYNQDQDPNDVVTPEERHRMMRGIVLGRDSMSRSKSAQMRAVNSASQPLRRSGSLPARIR